LLFLKKLKLKSKKSEKLSEFEIGDKVLIKGSVSGYHYGLSPECYEEWKEKSLTIEHIGEGVSKKFLRFKEVNFTLPEDMFKHDSFFQHKKRMINA
jgi:hypothetical protein